MGHKWVICGSYPDCSVGQWVKWVNRCDPLSTLLQTYAHTCRQTHTRTDTQTCTCTHIPRHMNKNGFKKPGMLDLHAWFKNAGTFMAWVKSLVSTLPAVLIMRYVWDLWDMQWPNYSECYQVIMNTELDTRSSEVVYLLQ